MKILEVWTVEWSEKQQCFHVDYLENTIQKGVEQFLQGSSYGDWILIGVFDKHEQAHEVVEHLRSVRKIPTLSEKLYKENV